MGINQRYETDVDDPDWEKAIQTSFVNYGTAELLIGQSYDFAPCLQSGFGQIKGINTNVRGKLTEMCVCIVL